MNRVEFQSDSDCLATVGVRERFVNVAEREGIGDDFVERIPISCSA